MYPLAPSLDTVGWLGASLSAIELGMRLVEPGFTVDAALDGITVEEAGTLDTDATGRISAVIIDSEGYRANEHLLPDLERLEPHIQVNMREGAAYTAADAAAALGSAGELRGFVDTLIASYGFLVLPVLVGAPPRVGERGISLIRLTVPFNLTGHPALAIPLPGLPYPMALQVVGPHLGEERLLAFAAQLSVPGLTRPAS